MLLEIGKVKVTENQIKKHFSQFTSAEHDALINLVETAKRKPIQININHIKEKNQIITNRQLASLFHNYNIIEYNKTNGRNRVLLRSKKAWDVEFETANRKFTEKANLCISFCLDNSYIVTAYFNRECDSHRGLHSDRYQNFDILKEIM